MRKTISKFRKSLVEWIFPNFQEKMEFYDNVKKEFEYYREIFTSLKSWKNTIEFRLSDLEKSNIELRADKRFLRNEVSRKQQKIENLEKQLAYYQKHAIIVDEKNQIN